MEFSCHSHCQLHRLHLIHHLQKQQDDVPKFKFLSPKPTNRNLELTRTDFLLQFQLILTFNQIVSPSDDLIIFSYLEKKVDKLQMTYFRSRHALKASVASTTCGGVQVINKTHSERPLLNMSQYLSSICLIGLFAASLLSRVWSGHLPSAMSASEQKAHLRLEGGDVPLMVC